MLNGYKTYILAALAVVYGVLGFVMGWIPNDQALQVIWIGLTAAGLRNAIK